MRASNRRFKLASAAVPVVILLAVSSIAIRPVQDGSAVQAAGAPVASPAVDGVPPEVLADILSSAPFPSAGLPEGNDQPVVLPWQGNDGDLAGTIGAVTVQDADQPFPVIAVLIYPDPATAKQAFDGFVQEGVELAGDTADVLGFAGPAVLIDYGGVGICFVLVGNVIVQGIGTGDTAASIADAAVAAATAGVLHVERLAADYQAGVRPRYATGVLADVPPRAFVEGLLAEPFPATDLPEGFDDPTLVAWEDETDTDLFGTEGAALVEFEDGAVGIAYLVFPNEGAAAQRLRQPHDGAVSDAAGTVAVGGVDYPARILGYGDYTVCLVQVDYLIVIGNGEADQAVAIAFARAGAAHAISIASSVTATPAATPT